MEPSLWAKGLLDFKLLQVVQISFHTTVAQITLNQTKDTLFPWATPVFSHFSSFLTFFVSPGSSFPQLLRLTKCERDTLGEVGPKKM